MLGSILCFMLFSCSKGQNEEVVVIDPPSDKVSYGDFNYEKIGQLHNAGLNFLLTELQSLEEVSTYKRVLPLNDKMMRAHKIDKILRLKTEEFVVSSDKLNTFHQEYFNSLPPLGELISFDGINKRVTSENNLGFDILEERLYPIIEDNLTATQSRVFLSKITIVFNNLSDIEDYSIENSISDLIKIGREITDSINNLPKIDFMVLQSMVSTGVASLEYWQQNLGLWEDLGPSLFYGKRDWKWFKDTVKKMGRNDLVGAGVGAIATAPSLNPLVIGAGAVGYGMNTSAMTGLTELLFN